MGQLEKGYDLLCFVELTHPKREVVSGFEGSPHRCRISPINFNRTIRKGKFRIIFWISFDWELLIIIILNYRLISGLNNSKEKPLQHKNSRWWRRESTPSNLRSQAKTKKTRKMVTNRGQQASVFSTPQEWFQSKAYFSIFIEWVMEKISLTYQPSSIHLLNQLHCMRTSAPIRVWPSHSEKHCLHIYNSTE